MRPPTPSLAAIAACIAIAGCTQVTQPLRSSDHPSAPGIRSAAPAGVNQYPQITGREHSLHLEADVEVTPRVFVSGSTIEIVVRVRNTSHDTLAVMRCPFFYAFFDESGKDLGPYFVCADFPTFISVAPGETVERTFSQIGYWAPGKYKVYARVGELPLQHPFSVEILTPAS